MDVTVIEWWIFFRYSNCTNNKSYSSFINTWLCEFSILFPCPNYNLLNLTNLMDQLRKAPISSLPQSQMHGFHSSLRSKQKNPYLNLICMRFISWRTFLVDSHPSKMIRNPSMTSHSRAYGMSRMKSKRNFSSNHEMKYSREKSKFRE